MRPVGAHMGAVDARSGAVGSCMGAFYAHMGAVRVCIGATKHDDIC